MQENERDFDHYRLGFETPYETPTIPRALAHSDTYLVTESCTVDPLASFVASLNAEQRANLLKLLAGGS